MFRVQLQSGNPDGGLYIATPVYSAITKQLYITLPTTFTANTITGSYTLNQGVAAFTINSDCTLRLRELPLLMFARVECVMVRCRNALCL